MAVFDPRNHVIAVRIYFLDDGDFTPMADLLMPDGVVEHIQWNDVKQRKPYEKGINGYTLIYDERPKRDWSEWFSMDPKTKEGLIVSIRKNCPCDVDGVCPYDAEYDRDCEYWCGAEEPEDYPEDDGWDQWECEPNRDDWDEEDQ